MPNITEQATSPTNTSSSLILDELLEKSLNNQIGELEKLASESVHVMGRIAIKGQITVIYAEPNTGKTLITLALISEAISNDLLSKYVFHFNIDDNLNGLIEKVHLGKRHGFQTVSANTFKIDIKEAFFQIIDQVIEDEDASDAVFILDTVKKFTDVMDKRLSSKFMQACRRFTQVGGTIIALSHTNKHRDCDGRPVPSGTSDLKDDCDCAYTMQITDQKTDTEGNTEYIVEFNQIKSRGPSVEQATYQYTKFSNYDYERMFNSVKLIDGNEADKLRIQKAQETKRNNDQPIIDEIVGLLKKKGTLNTTELIELIPESCSRRKTEACLKQWSGSVDEGALWAISKGAHNSSNYTLH